MNKEIYLDYSTTSRPSEKSVGRILTFLTHLWGTPFAPHHAGQKLLSALEEGYQSIYTLLDASEKDRFIFTSSGAEAVNHAFFATYFDITRSTGKNQFVTSKIEEAPALMSISRLEQLGCVGKMVAPDDTGRISATAIESALTPRTALVSLSWANGLTGTIQPIAEIAAICKQRNIRLHLDVTHVLGKLFLDLPEIRPDLISFNGEQIHASQGTGGLFIREGVQCSPWIVGGLEQSGQRAGNMNLPAFMGLAQAAKEALDTRDFLCTEVARLRDLLEEELLSLYPEARIPFRNQERLPHCSVILFPGIANEALLHALNRQKVFATIGGGNFQQLRLLLAASGVPNALAQTAVGFQLSRETTEEEIRRAAQLIAATAARLRQLSIHLESICT